MIHEFNTLRGHPKHRVQRVRIEADASSVSMNCMWLAEIPFLTVGEHLELRTFGQGLNLSSADWK
jgi:hypothetical protein